MTLSENEYFEVIATAAERGIGGGKIDNALILRCAEKTKAEAVFTWNLADFRQIADAELAARIRVPVTPL